MCCITLGVLLCSVSVVLLSLDGTDPPPLGGPSAAPPLGSVSLLMTRQARALALVT